MHKLVSQDLAASRSTRRNRSLRSHCLNRLLTLHRLNETPKDDARLFARFSTVEQGRNVHTSGRIHKLAKGSYVCRACLKQPLVVKRPRSLEPEQNTYLVNLNPFVAVHHRIRSRICRNIPICVVIFSWPPMRCPVVSVYNGSLGSGHEDNKG